MATKNMLPEHLKVTELDKEVIQKIFETAFKIHSEHPFDVAHDWQHHQAVALNGLEIIDEEGLWNSIDIPIFLAASLFHDLERGSKTHTLALTELKKIGFSEDSLKNVADLINQHSFGDKQIDLSGKILWAADKIEYVSKERFIVSVDKLSKAKMAYYGKLWNSRIEAVSQRFDTINLPFAKEKFFSKFNELRKYIENERPEYKSWLKDLSF